MASLYILPLVITTENIRIKESKVRATTHNATQFFYSVRIKQGWGPAVSVLGKDLMEICVPLPKELTTLSHLSHLYMQNDLGRSGTHYLFPWKKGFFFNQATWSSAEVSSLFLPRTPGRLMKCELLSSFRFKFFLHVCFKVNGLRKSSDLNSFFFTFLPPIISGRCDLQSSFDCVTLFK